MSPEICLGEGRSVRNQYLAAIVVNIMSFCHGCSTGWISPFLPIMSGDDTPLETKLTTFESSMVASVMCIGGLVATPIYGGIADKFGRKKAVLFSAIPYVFCWMLKLVWRTSTGIMIARVLSGLGGAGPFLVGPTYCVEIASLATKGVLGSLMVFSINAGILAMYILGAFFSYTTCAIVGLTLPITFFLLMLYMPETPAFLVKQKRDEEAAKSIAWLRSEKLDSEVVLGVLSKIKHENDRSSKKDGKDSSKDDVPSWKFFFSSTPTLKAFSVCFMLLTVQTCTGMFAVITYANDIFKNAGSSLAPAYNSIVIGVLQLVGSTVGSFTIEKIGRKVLLISSCIIVALGNAALGTYFYAIYREYDVTNISWLPVTSLSLVVSSFAMGIGPIPYLLPSEIIHVQGRGIASSISVTWVWILSFTIAQAFNPLTELIGSHSVFWLFALATSAGIAITMMLLPETKGKSFESNVAFYTSKKDNKVLVAGECENGELL